MALPVSDGSCWLLVREVLGVTYQCDDCFSMRAEGFLCTRSEVKSEHGRFSCRACFNEGGLRLAEGEPAEVS